MRRIHGVEDILLGFEPKDAGSIPAGSVLVKSVVCGCRFWVLSPNNVFINYLLIEFSDSYIPENSIRDERCGNISKEKNLF